MTDRTVAPSRSTSSATICAEPSAGACCDPQCKFSAGVNHKIEPGTAVTSDRHGGYSLAAGEPSALFVAGELGLRLPSVRASSACCSPQSRQPACPCWAFARASGPASRRVVPRSATRLGQLSGSTPQPAFPSAQSPRYFPGVNCTSGPGARSRLPQRRSPTRSPTATAQLVDLPHPEAPIQAAGLPGLTARTLQGLTQPRMHFHS